MKKSTTFETISLTLLFILSIFFLIKIIFKNGHERTINPIKKDIIVFQRSESVIKYGINYCLDREKIKLRFLPNGNVGELSPEDNKNIVTQILSCNYNSFILRNDTLVIYCPQTAQLVFQVKSKSFNKIELKPYFKNKFPDNNEDEFSVCN